MSVQSEINRIKGNVTAALAKIAEKGVTVPDGANSDNLEALIEAISAGGGGSGGAYFSIQTLSTASSALYFTTGFMPDVLVITGPVGGGSSNYVGLAIHIQDADGGVYQEKWRYQSTKYLVGTSATDGSLFNLSVNTSGLLGVSIKAGESSYGSVFAANKEYKVFAAKIL